MKFRKKPERKLPNGALEIALRNVVQWSDACWRSGYAGNPQLPHPAWDDVQEGRRILKEIELLYRMGVIIEAIRWTSRNFNEVVRFCPTLIDMGSVSTLKGYTTSWNLSIPTLKGNHVATIGDWIIKSVKGEFYPCKPDIFEKTYEPVEEKK